MEEPRSYAGPWCVACEDDAYLERFASACGVAKANVGSILRLLSKTGRRCTSWDFLESNYEGMKARQPRDSDTGSDDDDADDDDADDDDEFDFAEVESQNAARDFPTMARVFPEVNSWFGPIKRPPNYVHKDCCHLRPEHAPRRRLLSYCSNLHRSKRESLSAAVAALRSACAECTHKMVPTPYPSDSDE